MKIFLGVCFVYVPYSIYLPNPYPVRIYGKAFSCLLIPILQKPKRMYIYFILKQFIRLLVSIHVEKSLQQADGSLYFLPSNHFDE